MLVGCAPYGPRCASTCRGFVKNTSLSQRQWLEVHGNLVTLEKGIVWVTVTNKSSEKLTLPESFVIALLCCVISLRAEPDDHATTVPESVCRLALQCASLSAVIDGQDLLADQLTHDFTGELPEALSTAFVEAAQPIIAPQTTNTRDTTHVSYIRDSFAAFFAIKAYERFHHDNDK